MTQTERITVAEASEGFGGDADTGTEISLPVVELLTGRGFVTGKSGSGKSNSASVIAEKLLDSGFGLLIVDIDGEYYGLKEEYEILHAGADEECDIQITADHAEKLASLALEQNVPIILDVSSYLDESEAEEVLTAVARSLFAKAKKQKQPFLLLVEEVHEYIPENGSIGECGRMLIKIGKRGRKHGLGICGISQRPADVKKDFITQCDWLLWHRLTWDNDTKVVGRILDHDYADAVENLDDGEGFLVTDWMDSVRRVQFYRKQTFDAGATPGLDDFERPELKSVSDDLVSELQEISEDEKRTENRIAELREELDQKNSRIAELERELQDARDLSRMAEQFVDSLVEEVNGAQPGKTERERMRESAFESTLDTDSNAMASPPGNGQERSSSEDPIPTQGTTPEDQTRAAERAGSTETTGTGPDSVDFDEAFDSNVFGDVDATAQDGFADGTSSDDGGTVTDGNAVAQGSVASTDGGTGVQSATNNDSAYASDFSAAEIKDALNSVSEMAGGSTESPEGAVPESGMTAREEIERTIHNDGEIVENEEFSVSVADEADISLSSEDGEPAVVQELKAEIADLPTKTRRMLAFYREMGTGTPLNAHFGAGGDGSRTDAYAHNRRLRTRGLVEHVGRGYYTYCLRELLESEFEDHRQSPTETELTGYVTDIESAVLFE